MTRSQLVFWPLLLSILAITLLNGGRFVYQLLYILWGILLFSLVYSVGASLTVKLRIILPRRYVSTGHRMYWRVVVKNGFFLPLPALTLSYFVSEYTFVKGSDTFQLKPNQRIGVDVEQIFTCRGSYEVGVSRWRSPDYLALFRASRRIRDTARVDVLPKVVPLDGVGYNRPEVESPAFLHTAQPEFDGTRPYENTDPMRSIHWKLSAKTDLLMVKKTRGLIPTPVCVLIDMTAVPCGSEVRVQREDKLLETAFSLVRHLMSAGPVQVVSVTRDPKSFSIRSKADFAEMYRTLGLAAFEPGVPDDVAGQLELDPNAALWMVSSHAGGAMAELMTAQQAQDRAAYWIYIPSGDEPERDEQNMLDSISAMGLLTAVILPHQDIRDVAWMFE